MIGLGVGIDYSLFIVTRFRQLLHDGLVAAGRGRRGRRVGRPRGDLRRPDRRDLGHRAGLHRPRLRDQARHRQRPRRADDGADRELAAAGGAGAARAQDRPAEGAVPAKPLDDSEEGREKTLVARWGRFVTAHAQDRLPGRRCWSSSPLAATSSLVRLGAADQGTQPEGADQPPRLRPARRGLRPRLQRPDPDRRRRERRPAGAAEDLRRRAGPRGRRLRRASRSSTTRRPSRSSS